MRPIIITILIFLSHQVYGQANGNQHSAWDTLFAKRKQVLLFYQERLNNNLFSVDTLYAKDSVILKYHAASGKVLEKITKYINETGCINYIKHIYYNNSELISYIIKNKEFCPAFAGDTMPIFYELPQYERFEYDKFNRPVLHIFTTSTPSTIKEIFTYDKAGIITTKRQFIYETEFWD